MALKNVIGEGHIFLTLHRTMTTEYTVLQVRNPRDDLVDWGKIPVLRIGRKSIVRVDVICCFMQINEGRDLLDRNQVLSVD
jgi:hypothetical protein